MITHEFFKGSYINTNNLNKLKQLLQRKNSNADTNQSAKALPTVVELADPVQFYKNILVEKGLEDREGDISRNKQVREKLLESVKKTKAPAMKKQVHEYDKENMPLASDDFSYVPIRNTKPLFTKVGLGLETPTANMDMDSNSLSSQYEMIAKEIPKVFR